MPAISGPFGPIVEPGWIGGAEMPGQPDLVKSYLSAAQLSASVNAKQQAMENQLAHYALQAKEAEASSARREDYFNLATSKFQWDRQKDQEHMQAQQDRWKDEADSARRLREIQDAGLQIKRDREQRIADKLSDQNEATAGANQVLADMQREGIGYGHPLFESEYTKRITPWLAQSAAVENIRSNNLNKSNAVRDDNVRSYEADLKSWNNRVGQTLGVGGNTLEQNVPVIMHPENFLTDQTDRGFWEIGSHKTGKKIYKTSTGEDKVIDPSDIAVLRQDWNALEARKSQLAAPIHQPDIGVSNIEPAPAKQEDMVPNHTYRFPTGVFRWTGSDLVPVIQ